MPFYASKLPTGLKVEHGGQTVILNGANIGEELDSVSKNGAPRENRMRVHGYGLTDMTPPQADAFEGWRKEVTLTKDGMKVVGGFQGFENGSILGPFKSWSDAEKECSAMSGLVTTGFEGVDPEKEAKKAKNAVETRKE